MIGNFLQGNNYFDAFRQRNVFTEESTALKIRRLHKLAGVAALCFNATSNNGFPFETYALPLVVFEDSELGRRLVFQRTKHPRLVHRSVIIKEGLDR